MKILVIGSGGREHALAWKLRQSPRVDKLYCAPGSAGIRQQAEPVDIAAGEIEKLADFAAREAVDLTVVGPEQPLVHGIADLFDSRGLKVFGPNREAARLEGSKAFAKELMLENGIPTAACEVFSDLEEARRYVGRDQPCVVKADGLAAGKGVILCSGKAEAEAALDAVMGRKVFGAAGDRVVIEELLIGEEASFMALMDGEDFLPLASSQDHKRIFDGDKGPNTGGMGAYSPAPVVDAAVHEAVVEQVLKPLAAGLRRRGLRYRGVLYVGLMITEDGPRVLEFNCRFGDPECQPIMMRLKSDLPSLLMATAEGRLRGMTAEWSHQTAVCVVLASAGYPGEVQTGMEISGLDALDSWSDGYAFHAGTKRQGGRWLTGGGRVLGVTALGDTIEEATREAYDGVSRISWEGMHYRQDIARRAMERG
ncbi:MAG: phosphoribosylamine--glycine ligase [Deltaproteobacteria bacterium]|nr:phosphoribosylamine--glycine ligase [Deltaproteobacteria bacterium]